MFGVLSATEPIQGGVYIYDDVLRYRTVYRDGAIASRFRLVAYDYGWPHSRVTASRPRCNKQHTIGLPVDSIRRIRSLDRIN